MTVHLVLPLEYQGTRISAEKKKYKKRGYHLEGPAPARKPLYPDNLVAHIRWLHEDKNYTSRKIAELFPEINELSLKAMLLYRNRPRIEKCPCIEYMDRLE